MGKATRWALLTALALGGLMLAGCGDDDGGGEDTAETTEAADDGATSTTAGAEPPVNVVEPYDPALTDEFTQYLGENEVTVEWYAGDGTYTAVYQGLDLTALPPLCPGNSVETGPGSFENVSNAPTEDGGCDGVTTPEGELEVCGDVVVYTTQIPLDAEGTLYGTIDFVEGGQQVGGGTGTVEADPNAPPFNRDDVC